MANISTKNTTSPAILVAIVVLGLIVGYFYYNQTLRDQTLSIQPVSISAEDKLVKFKDLKLDFSALDNLTFKTLRIFGESPVQSGSTGRTDIFAPF